MMSIKEHSDMILSLTERLSDSINNYNKAWAECGHAPMSGCNVERIDSKEAIKRKILLLRDELLVLSKSLD